MAHILIDGYNLIGTAHDNLEKARDSIIRKLQGYARVKMHDVTIVFDGWKSGHKDQTRLKSGHVTIIYSRIGEDADTVIKKILASATTPWIVVSSDREVSDFAFRHDFAAVHSEEFEFKVQTSLPDFKSKNMNEEESPEQDITNYHENMTDAHPDPRKGNPRQLSKRQKRKLQALRKL